MIKIGKIGRANLEANKRLKQHWIESGIRSCEIRLEGCWGNNGLQNVHRHKRDFYKGDVDKLSDWKKQVVLGCPNCHNLIEYDKELTEKVFLKLRGKE